MLFYRIFPCLNSVLEVCEQESCILHSYLTFEIVSSFHLESICPLWIGNEMVRYLVLVCLFFVVCFCFEVSS